jgi:hypothetical protein
MNDESALDCNLFPLMEAIEDNRAIRERGYFEQFSGDPTDTPTVDPTFVSDELGIDERFILINGPLVYGDKALMRSEYMTETRHG